MLIRYRGLLPVGLLLGLFGLGVVALARAHDDPLAPVPKDAPWQFIDPDRGLTDDEIRAKDRAMIERQREKNRAFALEFQNSGQDPRPLARSPLMSELDASLLNIADAVRNAELIVRVSVLSTTFEPESVVSQLRILEVLKGPMDTATVALWQVGGPVVNDRGQTILAEAEWDPILLEGDEAILLLRMDPTSGDRYVTLPGQNYLIKAARIAVPETGSFEQFDGRPADELIGAIRAEVHP